MIRKGLFDIQVSGLSKHLLTFDLNLTPSPGTVIILSFSNKYDVSYSHSYLIMLTRLFFVTNFLFTAISSVGIDFILVSQAILPLDGTKRINSCFH